MSDEWASLVERAQEPDTPKLRYQLGLRDLRLAVGRVAAAWREGWARARAQSDQDRHPSSG